MTSDFETDAAVQSLARRLQDWDVADPFPKARAFMDDLSSRGWKFDRNIATRQPPKLHEECRTHPGQYAHRCSGCAADVRAARDDAEVDRAARTRLSRDDALAAMRAEVAAAKERRQVESETTA